MALSLVDSNKTAHTGPTLKFVTTTDVVAKGCIMFRLELYPNSRSDQYLVFRGSTKLLACTQAGPVVSYGSPPNIFSLEHALVCDFRGHWLSSLHGVMEQEMLPVTHKGGCHCRDVTFKFTAPRAWLLWNATVSTSPVQCSFGQCLHKTW